MEFVYLRFPKALKQAFLCTWAKYVVMPQKKEGDGEALKSSGHTTPLLWWNRWSPPPLGLGHQSQILLPGAFLMGSGSLGLEATCPVPCTPRPTILKASCQGRRVWKPPR